MTKCTRNVNKAASMSGGVAQYYLTHSSEIYPSKQKVYALAHESAIYNKCSLN